MLYSIFTLVLGVIIGGVGIRLSRSITGFHVASRGRLVRSAPGEAVRDDDGGRRTIGRLLMLIGVVTIVCSVIRVAGFLVGS
jgi:hypothetical protein